jgi:predicted phage terminase large subunit-like protein
MKLTEEEEIELLRLLEQEELNENRLHHLNFMDYTWRKRDPFIKGFHTKKICTRIDQAFEDFRNGKSTYLLINVHHRSGKSDIVSRYLGAHFLGEFPDQEVMQVSYQAALSVGFSSFGRNVFRSDKFKELYPDIQISRETNQKNNWIICDKNGKDTGGKLYASGLTSGLTGNGFALGILDDYCAGRKEAESKVQRDSAWDAFTNDFMTRVAPVGIIIILATQWHWDDITGRILAEMETNPDFPKFERLSFPAKAKDWTGEGSYPGKYLFLDRFSESWYRSQYATLGKYAAAALLDCDPHMRTGGILSTDGIVYENPSKWPDVVSHRWDRVWDLAHTAKQRSSDSPDWTSGTLLHFEYKGSDPVPHLYIRNVARIREGAAKRDKFIKTIVRGDGTYVRQNVENTVESKDAYDYLCQAMPEISWREVPILGDKLVRATPLEPIFESPGHVHVPENAAWISDWLDELLRFDGAGKDHDDQVDNLSAGYIVQISGKLNMSKTQRQAMAERRNR